MASSPFLPPLTFRTARLVAMPPRPEDAPAALAAYASDLEVTRYLSWPAYQEAAPLAKYFEERATDWKNGGPHFVWLLRRKGDATPIGTIGCIVEGGKLVFGYVLGRAHWGQGLASEVLSHLVDWSLAQTDVVRAWAYCDVENPASARVMEKSGMSREGLLRRWHVCPNLGPQLRDCFIYSRVR